MNIVFKILWFEDEVSWRPSSERKMKEFIESHNLVPQITWKKGDEEDTESELEKDYDLILMDYELRGTTGNILIKKLRQLDIYTDVLFYSGNFEKMVHSLYSTEEEGYHVDPVDGIYFSYRKREELYPKMQRIIDKIVRRMQDVVNLRGVVLDNVSGFESQMQNILLLALNKFTNDEITKLDDYVKKELVTPAKTEYTKRIEVIENSEEVLKAIVQAPDYLLDSYKKARLVGRVMKILKSNYGRNFGEKYNKFAESYFNEIIKYRNALGHAMRNKSDKKEVYIGEVDGQAMIFNEELFRKMRASIREYQEVINQVEDAFNDI